MHPMVSVVRKVMDGKRSLSCVSMDNRTKLMLVQEAIYNSQMDPEDLVIFLEITIEELVRKYPKKLVEHAEKFGIYDYQETEN